MSKILAYSVLLLASLVTSFSVLGQSEDVAPRVRFIPSPKQQFGFDTPSNDAWSKNYATCYLSDSSEYRVAFKSLGYEEQDFVCLTFDSIALPIDDLQFSIGDSIHELAITETISDTITIQLPAASKNYALNVLYQDQLIGKLNVMVYPKLFERLVLVPIVDVQLNDSAISSYVNSVYAQANLELGIAMSDVYTSSAFEVDTFSNPTLDHIRYTDQMIQLRDLYIEDHAEATGAYIIFIIPGFTNDSIQEYMVRNKGVGFIAANADRFEFRLARMLGYGMGGLNDVWEDDGPAMGSTNNLMDTTAGIRLTFIQWNAIQHSAHSISYFDNYEDVRTKNGLIACYFWEEDEHGNVVLSSSNYLKSISRPFKRNQYSLHLEIKNFLFVPLYTVFNVDINLLHVLTFLLILLLSRWTRRKIMRRLNRDKKRNWFSRTFVRLIVFTIAMFAYSSVFVIISEAYLLFEVKGGHLEYLGDATVSKAEAEIRKNENKVRLEERRMGSEVLIKRGNQWFMERRKPVLYFDVVKKDGKTTCTLTADSDTLTLRTRKYKALAKSHYFVFSYHDENGVYVDQRAYNHVGVDMTDKLELKDPAKRILLFVNGYRPTSLGASFEENFNDIRKKGLEFPESKNLIYTFDRYDYWRPWKEIDLLFQKRINPSETYYADGHFSVTTSNHRSLLNFTKLSAVYPKRCKDPNHHVCRRSVNHFGLFSKSSIPTVDLHNLKPNKEGFKQRVFSGRIAGRNLEQMFNEVPNMSENDTLYIVAHSMGFAYAEGIVEQLRGKINFGGFYIIAPENASVGEIKLDEWKEVWQYGSDFERNRLLAPCLLDGIAPQSRAGGITEQHRAFIPEDHFRKQGFFNSHFIGYYTWIFDIPPGEIGYIPQR